MVLNYCFYKIHQLLIIVNVNNKQKPFTHPTVNPFFNDYYNIFKSKLIIVFNSLIIRLFQLATFSEEKRFFTPFRMTIYVTLNGVKGLSKS